MTGYIIAPLIWSAYLLTALLSARRWFGSIRPYREPIGCGNTDKYHTHYSGCYERVVTIDSQGMAVFVAICGGLFWPVTWAIVLSAPPLKRWFTKASPDLPEETAAKIARMERDLKL